MDEVLAGINIVRTNINNQRYTDNTTLMSETEEEIKNLLMKVKEESEKNWLKTQHLKNEDHVIWSHHFMTNRWGNNGHSGIFISLGSKIIADVDCCHEIKRHLFLGRTAMPNLDSVLKGRDITLPTKAHIVKAMIFPVVMYGCESWIIKMAEN